MPIWNPGTFQGAGKKKNYFEGWYFKSVDRDERAAYAVIPGVSLAADCARTHAFVMLMDARRHRMFYFRHPLAEFRPHPREFEVRIGNSFFSVNALRLDLQDDQNRILADLRFRTITPWPVRLLSPGAMGWYSFVPFMQCYHGVLSFDHDIEGSFEINGEQHDFSGGKGYLEKDWGTSMPSSWIWMQTNHFERDGISLFGSIARIPWLGRSFSGTIFGWLFGGRLYRFATYTGTKVEHLVVRDDRIEVRVADARHALELDAERAKGVDLPAPALGDMTAKVNETLNARINVRFFRRDGGARELLFSGTGRNAGLEFVGDVRELLHGFRT
jgi:hypothetical protein